MRAYETTPTPALVVHVCDSGTLTTPLFKLHTPAVKCGVTVTLPECTGPPSASRPHACGPTCRTSLGSRGEAAGPCANTASRRIPSSSDKNHCR